MKLAIEKIDIRIVLICNKNNLNFNIVKSEKQIAYIFPDIKLAYSRIEVNLGENLNVSNITLHGYNNDLLKIADNINSKQTLFGLPIQSYRLTRLDAQKTTLNVAYSKEMIEAFEKSNYISDTMYTENFFLDKKSTPSKPLKRAYSHSSTTFEDPIRFISWKTTRPENYFIEQNADMTPDENGNINCHFCVNCTNCINCIGCINCTDCDECTNCYNCTMCSNSSDLIMCSQCDSCLECTHCKHLIFCDGLMTAGNVGSQVIYFGDDSNSKYLNYKLFPDSGTTFYDERIESFFLMNRFVPYIRSYDNVTDRSWSIQWKITMKSRRYWITETPSKKYENRFYSIVDLASFILMNKLKYLEWEEQAFIREYYNYEEKDLIISDPQKFIINILMSVKDDKLAIFEDINTKKPSDCFYNHLLYNSHLDK